MNYNRYSYCFGNPLIYTDPSGYQLLPADEGRAVDAYGSWSTGADFMTDYKNQRGAGGGGGSYTYNWDNGNYYNQNGDIVNYWEVYHNYILPNVANGNEFDYIYRHNTEVGGISGDYIDGFKLNGVIYEFNKPIKYGEKIGGRINDGNLSGYGGTNFSLAGMYYHFQFGGTEPMTINASSIDFSGTNQRELGLDKIRRGQSLDPVNLFNAGINSNSLAFGNLKMTRVSDTQFSIADNMFNFDFPPGTTWKRDAGTVLGAAINYNLMISPAAALVPLIFGGPYNVIFKGTVTIPK